MTFEGRSPAAQDLIDTLHQAMALVKMNQKASIVRDILDQAIQGYAETQSAAAARRHHHTDCIICSPSQEMHE